MTKPLTVAITFCTVGALMIAGTSWCQQPAPVQRGAFGRGEANFGGDWVGAYPNAQNVFMSQYPGSSVRSEIGQLMHQLREADDAAKKAEITKELETAVAKFFDEDMATRETELTKLEERLTKLRAQLDRRRRAKSEIIQLQIKVLVNEAEGLGFSGSSFFETGPFGGMTPYPAAGMQVPALREPKKK